MNSHNIFFMILPFILPILILMGILVPRNPILAICCSSIVPLGLLFSVNIDQNVLWAQAAWFGTFFIGISLICMSLLKDGVIVRRIIGGLSGCALSMWITCLLMGNNFLSIQAKILCVITLISSIAIIFIQSDLDKTYFKRLQWKKTSN